MKTNLKNNIIIFSILAIGIFMIPNFVLGAITYSRTPATDLIYYDQQPMTFNVSFDNFPADIENYEDQCPEGINYWNIFYKTKTPDRNFVLLEGNLASTTKNYSFEGTLPIGKIAGIYVFGGMTATSTYQGYCGRLLETNLSPDCKMMPGPECYIFEILDEGGGGTGIGTILTLPTSTTPDLLAYAGRLFTDLNPIVLLLLGIPVGFFIIKKSISLVSKRTKTRF